MTDVNRNAGGGVPRWAVISALALGFVLAVALIVVGVTRSARRPVATTTASTATESGPVAGTGPAGASTGGAEPGSAGSGAGGDGSGTPKPKVTGYPPGMRAPSVPDTSPPQGAPSPAIAGVYRLKFELRADTCASGAVPSTHDIEVSVDGPNVTVKDRLTGNTLTGPGGSDGRFVVRYSRDDKAFPYRELMVGRADGATLAGNYFVNPQKNDCVVEYEFSGPRV